MTLIIHQQLALIVNRIIHQLLMSVGASLRIRLGLDINCDHEQ